MKRKIGWALSLLVLAATGAIGVYNGVRDLPGAQTPLQYSVTLGVLLYGVFGLAGGATLATRHPWSVRFATVWGLVVTYVSSTAAHAYAGADATLVGAVAGGLATALIGAGVVWSARTAVRRQPVRDRADGLRALALIAVVAGGFAGVGGCRSSFYGLPLEGLQTKVVRAKREPDRLIAQDLTVCWVIPEVFASVRPGDHWRCDWQRYVAP